MKELRSLLFSYLKSHKNGILIILISFVIFAVIFSLYNLPVESVAYASIVTMVFVVLMAIFDFAAFIRHHNILKKLEKSITISEFMLPKAKNRIEEDYQIKRFTFRKRIAC